jgi:hypothetical protein
MNSLTGELQIRVGILLIMVCEWAFVFYCAPYVLRVTEEPKRLIYRAGSALLILGVIWIQGHLYYSVVSSPPPKGNPFLTAVYGTEHLVSLLLLVRAALVARAK